MCCYSNGKNVLIISYYVPPLGRGGVKRVTKFAKYLKQFGWNPIILSVKPIAYYAFDETLERELEGVPVIRTESLDLARILRIFGKKTIKPSFFTEGLSRSLLNALIFPDAKLPWVPFAIAEGTKLKRTILRPSIIFSTSPPYSVHIIGLYLARLYRVPLVVDFRDFWPTGIVPSVSFLRPFYKRIRDWIAKEADAVTAVYKDIVDDLGFGIHLPSGYDPVEVGDLPEFKLKGKIKFAFAGSLSLKEKSTLEFIRAIKEAPTGVTLHLAGVIPGRVLKEVDGQRVIYHGYLTARMALGMLNSADFLWYTQPKEAPASLKLYEYIGLGKPVFATIDQNTEAARMIQKHGLGLIVEPEYEKIVGALNYLISNDINFDPPKLIEFTRVQLTLQLIKLFTDLLCKGQTGA